MKGTLESRPVVAVPIAPEPARRHGSFPQLLALTGLLAGAVATVVPAVLFLCASAAFTFFGVRLRGQSSVWWQDGLYWVLTLAAGAAGTGFSLVLRRQLRSVPRTGRRLPAVAIGTLLGLVLSDGVAGSLLDAGATVAAPIIAQRTSPLDSCRPSRSCVHQVASAQHLTALLPPAGSGWNVTTVVGGGGLNVTVVVSRGADTCILSTRKVAPAPLTLENLGPGARQSAITVRGRTAIRTDVPHPVAAGPSQRALWDVRWTEGNAHVVSCSIALPAAPFLASLQPA